MMTMTTPSFSKHIRKDGVFDTFTALDPACTPWAQTLSTVPSVRLWCLQMSKQERHKFTTPRAMRSRTKDQLIGR